jgi:hypothetical protein
VACCKAKDALPPRPRSPYPLARVCPTTRKFCETVWTRYHGYSPQMHPKKGIRAIPKEVMNILQYFTSPKQHGYYTDDEDKPSGFQTNR